MAIHARLFVANGVTGQIVGDLPFSGVPTWSRQLNDVGALSATVPLFQTSLGPDMLQRLREPWRWIVGYSEGSSIRQMGYLVSAAYDETQNPPTATLTTKSMWDLLNSKRRVMNPGTQLQNANADVIFSATSTDPANQNLSLQGIARRLVEIATAGNLDLPVILPDAIAGTAQRSYAAADLAYTGQRLQELTQVENGPEVEFSPEFTDETRSYVTFRMRIGNTRLGQLGFPHSWSHGKAMQTLSTTMDGVDMAFDCIAKGQDSRQAADGTTPASGSLIWGQNSYISVYPNAGWPMLQTADTSHTDVVDQSTINGYANAAVKSNETPIYTASAVIRNDATDGTGHPTGSPTLDLISVGDTGIVTVKRHGWLDPGRYGIRILDISNGQDAFTSVLTLQLFT